MIHSRNCSRFPLNRVHSPWRAAELQEQGVQVERLVAGLSAAWEGFTAKPFSLQVLAVLTKDTEPLAKKIRDPGGVGRRPDSLGWAKIWARKLASMASRWSRLPWPPVFTNKSKILIRPRQRPSFELWICVSYPPFYDLSNSNLAAAVAKFEFCELPIFAIKEM